MATNALGPSGLELAAPFIIGLLFLAGSVVWVPKIEKLIEEHYGGGWTKDELESGDADKLPSTHAQAVPWIADAAVVPSVVLGPAAGLYILRQTYAAPFIIVYAAVAVIGAITATVFLDRTNIAAYYTKGLCIGPYRASPLVLSGIALNVVAALIAAFAIG